MAKNRMINTRFWDDSWVVGLDPLEKLLYLYLLTNAATSLTGCYELTLRRIAFDTGLDETAIKNILKRFESDKKVSYVNGWVVIHKYEEHNPFRGQKLDEAKSREVMLFPNSVLIVYKKGIDTSNKNKNNNKNISNNKNLQRLGKMKDERGLS